MTTFHFVYGMLLNRCENCFCETEVTGRSSEEVEGEGDEGKGKDQPPHFASVSSSSRGPLPGQGQTLYLEGRSRMTSSCSLKSPGNLCPPLHLLHKFI